METFLLCLCTYLGALSPSTLGNITSNLSRKSFFVTVQHNSLKCFQAIINNLVSFLSLERYQENLIQSCINCDNHCLDLETYSTRKKEEQKGKKLKRLKVSQYIYYLLQISSLFLHL